jgi:hypothetical protein
LILKGILPMAEASKGRIFGWILQMKISHKAIADDLVAGLRLLMVGQTKIWNKKIITEAQ